VTILTVRSAKSRVSSELLEGLALAKSVQCRLLNCTGSLDELDGEVAILTQPPVGSLALTRVEREHGRWFHPSASIESQ
jgi:hypothetical protein